MKIVNLFKRKIPGYSLVEISIVLLIIGIVTTAMLKGKSLIESTRMDTVINDIRSVQLAYSQYVDSYASIPGNDKGGKHLGSLESGNGNGVFCEEDASRVFSHLHAVGLIENKDFKIPKIGQKYSIVCIDRHPYIKIDGLSGKQIILFKTKLSAAFGTTINIKEEDSGISVQIDY